MKKLVIAVSGVSDVGKTTSIRLLYEQLKNNHSHSMIFENYRKDADFIVVLEINGKKVGIDSRGDKKHLLMESLYTLIVEYDCQIIVCACHMEKSLTRQLVNRLDRQKYDVKFIEKTAVTDAMRDKSNEKTANEILGLIQERLKSSK